MKKLLSSTYYPIGNHSNKAPAPKKNARGKNLKHMSKRGLKTVKFSIQWRYHHPAEERFYFEDIDRLMEQARKFKLRVILRINFDAAPWWIYNKYPDASMVTLSGRKIGPQTMPNRKIGGLGYCFNNDNVMKHLFRFLKMTVERYKNHSALEIWDVGSLQELTNGMAELRVLANDPNKISDLVCYCDNCRAKFKSWIETKYENINKLNDYWGRDYSSFDDIKITMTRSNINDLIDWRMFFVQTLGHNVEKRFDLTFFIDEGKHPILSHRALAQGAQVTSSADESWNVGWNNELQDSELMNDPGMINFIRACAKKKPAVNAAMST